MKGLRLRRREDLPRSVARWSFNGRVFTGARTPIVERPRPACLRAITRDEELPVLPLPRFPSLNLPEERGYPTNQHSRCSGTPRHSRNGVCTLSVALYAAT
jgi:hypothetical protein